MRKYFTVIAICIILSGCGRTRQTTTDIRQQETGSSVFVLPQVPAVLTMEDARLYLASHYWDKLDFTDTLLIHKPEFSEQAFGGYIQILHSIPYDKATGSIAYTLSAAERDSSALSSFAGLFEKYLHHPNSPFRNEELYIPVLEYLIGSESLPEIQKVRPEFQLQRALKNRVGTKAADIKIVLADGRKTSLYKIKSRYILLYFNNPDCTACKETQAAICHSPLLSELIRKELLTVFAVYSDEDIDAWRKNLPEMPKEWINGYDQDFEIQEKSTYDLPAIPSVYLLDENYNVLIKDALSVKAVEGYLLHYN